ncbi:alpha/beta fold hydrolase [Alphaproteobacteria bacterium GH1-50]|uniref:Alpha/beta fold hydrolase n=1 Tax=Kangsaoukella pontilimi TaxID=2691042 RepID=A0A7C9IIY8_9RHOB|nr:alpha/beta fold hydrolase [Kangsaoukella pontilimi]MXQ09567.1 alpha/beta fold hydrolase [Kangsaoukella pontilimi]
MKHHVPENAIDLAPTDLTPHYEPMGWHHWPEHPWLTYQFRRGLGETQEGGGAVSECFLAASRMIPGDYDSWHREWMRIADQNWDRGIEAERNGHIQTAKNCFLRAADYYRQAEFYLEPDAPNRLPTFEKMEACSHKFLKYLNPPGEIVDIPYEDGKPICGYFVRAPFPGDRMPVLICFGGLDSIKDEMWFMQAHGALQRGISVLMVDLPGQGGTLRRHKLAARPDTEVPVGACIDWLLERDDVDPDRIACAGSSMGGYYAARAACYEHRLAACIAHGAIWSVHEMWGDKDESFGLAMHIKWVMGEDTMTEALETSKAFALEGHLDHMQCPLLVLHGGHDVLTVSAATQVHDYATSKGVNSTLRLLQPDETGAEHCQHDNPTIGQEIMNDWLADVFGIDQAALLKTGWSPLI